MERILLDGRLPAGPPCLPERLWWDCGPAESAASMKSGCQTVPNIPIVPMTTNDSGLDAARGSAPWTDGAGEFS